MDRGGRLENQTLAGPVSVVGNALHIISSGVECSIMKDLKDSKWSRGPEVPSKGLTVGSLNFKGRGQFSTSGENAEPDFMRESAKVNGFFACICYWTCSS